MAEWLRHPSVETLVVTGSDPGLAKYLFLHFFLRKINTVQLAYSTLGFYLLISLLLFMNLLKVFSANS